MTTRLSVPLLRFFFLQTSCAIPYQDWSKHWSCLGLTLLVSILSARQLSAQTSNAAQAPGVTSPGSLDSSAASHAGRDSLHPIACDAVNTGCVANTFY